VDRKNLVSFWLALLLVAALSGAWLGLHIEHSRTPLPGLSRTVPLAADKSYGVTTDLAGYAPQDRDEALDRMRALGLGWIRQPFPWAQIEPAPDQYDWAAWDGVVWAASARGMRMIALLDTTPAWTRPPDTTPFTPPTELAEFGAFARDLAARYGDQVDYYQIWDEPNLSTHWGDRFVDPAAYAHLLREAAVNIRAADNKAIILTAALAPTIEDGPLNLNEPAFLTGLYAANAARWFDVAAVQPYGFDQGPAVAPEPNALNFNRPELARRALVANGDEQKAVWATAFGWSSLPQPWSGQPSPWPSVSPDVQGDYTLEALQSARSRWPWLGPMLFAAWDARSLPADDPRRGLALVSGEEELPPARALARLRERYDPYETIATVGTYPATHPSGHYSGDWRFSPAGADAPRHPPARLTIPFDGTRLDLQVRRGDFRGFLYVSVDGRPANQLPRQDGRAYLVLYDPLEQEEIVTLARFLPDSFHVAQIEAEGGWYQWPVVGWRVSREADTRGAQVGLGIVVGLGLLATIGLVGAGRRLSRRDTQSMMGWVNKVTARYMALGTPVHLLVLAGAALAFYLAPGTLMSLGLLGLLFLVILPRLDLGLGLVVFSLPFFLLPKTLIGRTISMTEISLLLVALSHVTRRTLTLLYASAFTPPALPSGPPVSWLDWSAWLLAGTALLTAVLTLAPLPAASLPAGVDWPVWTLMVLPLAGLLAALASADNRFQVRGPDVAIVALAALALAATLAAPSFGVSMQEFHVVVWDGAIFYAFVRLGRRTDLPWEAREKNAEGLAWLLVDALLLGATLAALYAIYQFLFTDHAITAEGVRRARGLYGSPNNLALLLDRIAPIMAAVAAFSNPAILQPKSPAQNDSTVAQIGQRRLLYALGLVPILVALILTFSRGALLLGLPAAILFLGIVRGGRVLWVALGVLAATAAGLVPLLGTERFRSLLELQSGTGFFRLRLWQSAWVMMRENRWLGVGLDNFLYQYRTRYILPDAWQEPNLSHPHNIILDFGTRLGLGGIAVLIWLEAAFWRVAWRLYRRQGTQATRALTLGLMASMVATLAHGLVDHSFFLVDLAFIFFLITGAIINLDIATK
jgi:O-antigen ligase